MINFEIDVSRGMKLGLQGRVDDRDVADDTRRFLVDTSWDYMLETKGWVGVECHEHLNNPSELKFHGCGR